MHGVPDLLERWVARALPVRDRDAILGDLVEECEALTVHSRGWRLWAMIRIAAHYQLEPYRDAEQRLASSIVALIGLGILWLVPLASDSMFVDPELLSRPVIRTAALIWGASHLTSALAIGLFVGRTSILPEVQLPTRWHLGIVFACTALVSASGWGAGVVSVVVLAVALWVGDVARRPHADQHSVRS